MVPLAAACAPWYWRLRSVIFATVEVSDMTISTRMTATKRMSRAIKSALPLVFWSMEGSIS